MGRIVCSGVGGGNKYLNVRGLCGIMREDTEGGKNNCDFDKITVFPKKNKSNNKYKCLKPYVFSHTNSTNYFYLPRKILEIRFLFVLIPMEEKREVN